MYIPSRSRYLLNVSSLDLGEVFLALYNRATPVEMGWKEYDPRPLTLDEAKEIMKNYNSNPLERMGLKSVSNDDTDIYFDYFKGRLMKVKFLRQYDEDGVLASCWIDPDRFDEYYGELAVYNAVKPLFEKAKK